MLNHGESLGTHPFEERMIRLAFLLSLAFSGSALAHPGGLNSEGCHNNRKTGDYHCHRSSGRSNAARAEPAPLFDSAPANRAFRNCTEARQAGAAPVHRGDPGYGTHLDRDRDGIGCE